MARAGRALETAATGRKSARRRAVACVVVCCAVAAATACERRAENKAALKAPPPKVVVAQVTGQTIPITMDLSGTVQAVKTVDIIPRVSGYIEKRYFTEGTHVKEGDPLYLIDPRPFQAKVDDYTAQLQSERASLKYWTSEAKRSERLAASGAGSVEKKEQAFERRDQARAAVDRVSSQLDNARLDLSFTHITAAFAGRVQNTKINVGQLVQAQRDVLTSLVQIDPIYAAFNLSRRQVYEIQRLVRQPSQTGKKVTARVSLPDGTPYQHMGTLDFVSAQIDPSTDTLMARVIFPNPFTLDADVHLIPGQYVPIRLFVGEDPGGLLIPESALVETQAGRFVFVVSKDNVVERRKVDVTGSYRGQWIVKGGLEKGERVVTEGVQKVRPGMTVESQLPARATVPKETAPAVQR